jgi:hypothetical protein
VIDFNIDKATLNFIVYIFDRLMIDAASAPIPILWLVLTVEKGHARKFFIRKYSYIITENSKS